MNALAKLAVVAVVLFAGVAAYSAFFTGGEPVAPEAFVTEALGGVVVDVRTEREYEAGHVAGAVNIPVTSGDFRERIAALPAEGPVYLYCASGVRSARAAGILEGLGREEVFDAGGMDDLAAAGAEIVR